MPHDQVWNNLSATQADGQACVICARSFRTRGSVCLPVGRSRTGSQVFACTGACAQTATAPGAVLIPTGALTAALAAFLRALEAVGGELPPGWPEELVTAAVTAAARLIVAAELRHLAGGSQVQQWESAFSVTVPLIPVAELTARANQLDPAGGGERR